jgi:hypothetical protein
MAHRLIRLTAMTDHHVRVYVYDTVDEMRSAGTRFNGSDHADSWGMTQAYADGEGRATLLIVRLCRERLDATVVSHEMHHAAAAIYGAGLGHRVSARAHLNHYNEPFAHLFSELMGRLNDRLWALGYHGER